MIPPTFHIGDEVLIIGPTITGCKLHTGERFTIEQVDHNKYSGHGLPYYPASSLRLVNEKPLSPMQVTYNYKPDDCEHGTIQVSCPCGRKAEIDPNWPKLDEELKIGDFAEVILEGNPFTGKIGQVSSIGELTVALYDMGIWSRESLRKLTPDEIAKYQASQMLPKSTEIQELRRRIHDLEMSLNGFTNGPEPEYVSGILHVKDPIRARLSAIEKQLKEQHEKISQFDGEISHLLASIQECLMESGDVEARTRCREMAIEKRLDFVEQFQLDQTRDALCKDWRAGP